jgi:hypothetical protein
MIETLKHILKKYAYRYAYHQKIGTKGEERNVAFVENNFKGALNIFTTHNEDGIISKLITNLNITEGFFVDIGSHDCINSNCANLAFHFNWSGIFIDADKKILQRGEYTYTNYFKANKNRFQFFNQFVEQEKINNQLAEATAGKAVDLMSIDIDGNDYHIWNAITSIAPKIVVIEVQAEKSDEEYVPPYNNTAKSYEEGSPNGASIISTIKLAHTKGYQLVAYNEGIFNLFFVHNTHCNNDAIRIISLAQTIEIIKQKISR